MRTLSRLALFCCFYLTAPLLPGQESAPPADPEPLQQHLHTPWLDEVRAQREAWEAQRRAAQKESTARLRLFDPWGAAQIEALDQEAESHRRALRQEAEQFRRSAKAKAEAQRRAREWRREEHDKWLWQYTPYTWENPWFWGGF